MQQAENNKSARRNEQPRTWFRSDRVYLMQQDQSQQDQWYFRTREGVEIGPYDSQFEAEIEAGLLRELIKGVIDPEKKRKIIREFVLDSFAMGHKLNPLFGEAPIFKSELATV